MNEEKIVENSTLTPHSSGWKNNRCRLPFLIEKFLAPTVQQQLVSMLGFAINLILKIREKLMLTFIDNQW